MIRRPTRGHSATIDMYLEAVATRYPRLPLAN